jgi:hypothetical protein
VRADIDQADEVTGGGEATGLGHVGEPVHDLTGAQQHQSLSELIGHCDRPVGRRGGVVRVSANRGVGEDPTFGKCDCDQRTGGLVGHQHRAARRGELQVSQPSR